MENKTNKTNKNLIIDKSVSRAKEITDSAKKTYQTEIQKLSLFIERWKRFTSETVYNYPSDKTRRLHAISQMLDDILARDERKNYTLSNKIEDCYKLIDQITYEEKPSLYGETESGFNMEDVLNPKGNLDLLELCKELGVDD